MNWIGANEQRRTPREHINDVEDEGKERDHSRRSTRDVMARDRVAPMLHPLLVRVARSHYPFLQS
jgi:hypothetical protein